MSRDRGRPSRGRIPAVVIRSSGAVLVVLAVTLGALAIPRAANACSPFPDPHPELAEYADKIAVAFVGRQIGQRVHSSAGVRLVFEVERVYKGSVGYRVELQTGYGDGDCGTDFGGLGTVGITAYPSGKSDLSVSVHRSTATVDELEDVFGVGYPPNPTFPVRDPVVTRDWIVFGSAVVLTAALIWRVRHRLDT